MVPDDDHNLSSDRARHKLEALLDEQKCQAGARLPPERQLAADLDVSRRALREALAQLEAEGRISRKVGRGTVVAASPGHGEIQPQLEELTSPVDLMAARLALEPSIAALAAFHATSRDMKEMQRCLDKSAGVNEHKGWELWDGALHRSISRATHNELITALFDLLNSARSHADWGQLRKQSLNAQRQHLYTSQHRAVLEAIKARDAERARQCMQTHLLTVQRTMFDPCPPEDAMPPPSRDDE